LTPTLEIKVKADVQQAAAGLKALLDDLTKTGTISAATTRTVQSALNGMTGALKGFSTQKFSQSFVASSGEIVSAAEKMAGAGAVLQGSFSATPNLSGIESTTIALQEQANTFNALIPSVKEFTQIFGSSFLRQFAGDAQAANQALTATFTQLQKGEKSFTDVVVSAGLTEKEFSKIPAGLQNVIASVNQTGIAASNSFTKIAGAAQQIDSLDFSGAFDSLRQSVNKNVDQAVAKALGLEKELQTFGEGINLSHLVSAFEGGTKSAAQLEREIEAVGQAVKLATNPAILDAFNTRLDQLRNKAKTIPVAASLKIEKVDVQPQNVPFTFDVTPIREFKNAIAAVNPQVEQVQATVAALGVTLNKAAATNLPATLQEIARENFAAGLSGQGQVIGNTFDQVTAKVLGVENLLKEFGASVNLSALVAAFSSADKSVEQLEEQVHSLKTAIAQTTDPVVLERFGQQLNRLTSQLSNLKVVGSVKVEKIDIPKIDVPLVAPKIDTTELQKLRVHFTEAINPIEQIKTRLAGLQEAVKKATDPVLVASFNAEIKRLGAQLNSLQFDKIALDPTSLQTLQSAFVNNTKTLDQLQAEIQVVETALKQATQNGSKDVGRLTEQLDVLKTKFDSINTSALSTAFNEGVKSVAQLQNEIFALGKAITINTSPEEIIRFATQIEKLEGELTGLKFGGIDVKVNTSGLTDLQSAFINTQKTAEQLQREIEALEQAKAITPNTSGIDVFNRRIIELKQQLTTVSLGSFEKNMTRAGQAAQKAGNGLRPYVKVSAEAMQATTNLGRILQDLPFGFIGIANNLNPALESFQRLQKEAGGLKGALRALGSSLVGPGGLGLALAAFQFIALDGVDAVKKMFGGADNATLKAKKLKEAADQAKDAAQAFVESLDDITQSRLKGTQNAQEELEKVKLLYDATQDQNISLANRKKLVDELQTQYPKYFQNIQDETILAGGAKDAYNQLTEAILASARARAGQDKLVEIQKQLLEVQEQSASAVQEEDAAFRNLQLRQKQYNKALQEGGVQGQGNVGFTKAIATAQQAYNDKIKATTKLKQQELDLQSRANKLADDLRSQVELNPESLLDPNKKIKDSIDKDKTKINFFDKFFDLTPPKQDVEKQLNEMFETAREFAQKNVGLFTVKVGQDFLDLSELTKIGDRREVVDLGKRMWASIQEGLIKFKPPKIDLGELQVEANATPVDNGVDFFNSFQRGFQSVLDKGAGEIGGLFTIPDRTSLLDDYALAFKRIGEQLPQVVEIEDIFGNLKNVDLTEALGDSTHFNFSGLVEALRKAFKQAVDETQNFKKTFRDAIANIGTEAFATIGQGIADLVSGGGIKDAFVSLFEFIGSALQDLGKQMIVASTLMKALKAALSKFDPTGGILAGIGLVAVGGIIKNLKPKGFATGGLVFGPTLGLVGEGSGTTRSNPEVIAPLNQLKQFLSPQSSNYSERLVAQVSGQNIDLVLQRFRAKQGRNG
jgi:hypothetical protein